MASLSASTSDRAKTLDAKVDELREEVKALHFRRLRRHEVGRLRLVHKIDAVIAMAMAVDRQAFRPEPVELVGWL